MNTETRECLELLVKVLYDLKQDPDTRIGYGMTMMVNAALISANKILDRTDDPSDVEE